MPLASCNIHRKNFENKLYRSAHHGQVKKLILRTSKMSVSSFLEYIYLFAKNKCGKEKHKQSVVNFFQENTALLFISASRRKL